MCYNKPFSTTNVKGIKMTKTTEIELLESVNYEVRMLYERLHGVVNQSLLKGIETIISKTDTYLKPIREEDDVAWEKNQEALDEISNSNKFRTVWSMTEVTSEQMSELTPPIKEIVYESWGPTQKHTFDKPTQITWLEVWKIADQLINLSGDTHHIFIESLEAQGTDGLFKLWTGS